jgi:hypothetical protein
MVVVVFVMVPTATAASATILGMGMTAWAVGMSISHTTDIDQDISTFKTYLDVYLDVTFRCGGTAASPEGPEPTRAP